jgi:glutamate/tyrosine decarboxylase-like PLP-dependent enzyme
MIPAASAVRTALPAVPASFDWEKFRADMHKVVDAIADYHIGMTAGGTPTLPASPTAIASALNTNAPPPAAATPAAATTQTAVQPSPASGIVPGFITHNDDLLRQMRALESAIASKAAPAGLPMDVMLKQWKDLVLPGVVHWQHRHFYGYFPANMTAPALAGTMLAESINQPGFSWTACPSATEVDLLVADYMAAFGFGLPAHRFCWRGDAILKATEAGASTTTDAPATASTRPRGGGILQPSATEATIVAMLAAKERKLDEKRFVGDLDDSKSGNAARLVCYFTDQSHFCVEKAAKVLGVRHVRKLKTVLHPTLENFPISAEDFEATVMEDKSKGLIPFFVSGNFGATATCAIDPLNEVGDIAQRHGMWFHVDAAYAGAALLLPKGRLAMASASAACVNLPAVAATEEEQRANDAIRAQVVEDILGKVDSININGSKWMGLMLASTFMYVADTDAIRRPLAATGSYLTQNAGAGATAVDLKDYQLGMGRHFRGYKVFVALQQTGISGFRATIERHCVLAQYLDTLLRSDNRFEVVTKTQFALVVFRLRNTAPERTLRLVEKINAAGDAYIISTGAFGGPAIRVALAHPNLDYDDMDRLYRLCAKTAEEVLAQ